MVFSQEPLMWNIEVLVLIIRKSFFQQVRLITRNSHTTHKLWPTLKFSKSRSNTMQGQGHKVNTFGVKEYSCEISSPSTYHPKVMAKLQTGWQNDKLTDRTKTIYPDLRGTVVFVIVIEFYINSSYIHCGLTLDLLTWNQLGSSANLNIITSNCTVVSKYIDLW
jgi:hypothetical protein